MNHVEELERLHQIAREYGSPYINGVLGEMVRREKMRQKSGPLTLDEFWNVLSPWSQEVFGTDQERGPIGPLKHLIKESDEAQKNPEDIIEYADCLFLVFDATRRAGFTYDQLCDAVTRKLAINKGRKWPKPTADQSVEHIRDDDEN